MPATAEQIARLRRMVDESAEDTYADATLAAYIERYALADLAGHEPENRDWTPTWDLHAAAADIWQEKAAVLGQDHDFSADGAQFYRSQAFQHAFRMIQYHRSRRNPRSRKVLVEPPVKAAVDAVWIGNLPEPDDQL